MKYTALTIGPIISSLALAQRTKELWAASFFFSFLMEKIIENIPDNDKSAIILPKVDKSKLSVKSAGIFPDRLILQSENGMFQELEQAVEAALKDVFFKFTPPDLIIKCDIFKKAEELKSYLNTHIVEFEYEDKKDKKTGENIDNPIFQANEFLANCELQASYKAKDSEFFLKMLQEIDKSEIYKEVFDKGKNFPSIIEISTKSLKLDQETFKDKEDEEEIWNKISKSEVSDKLKISHKYIAIVQADGDNIGAVIKDVAKDGDKNKITQFSEALSEFSLEAASIIDKYGGTSVYVGGDDLLFFAPLESTENQSIFSLIEELDKEFKTQITDKFPDVKEKPSMSYGISISYYKYPMREALKTAQDLLFSKAKNSPYKNAIAFKVLKHSGQAFEAVLKKPLNKEFTSLLNEDKGLVINSLIYNFDKHKSILKKVLEDSLKERSLDEKTCKEIIHNETQGVFEKTNKLNNFFKNFYNKEEHKKIETEDFINKVRDLLFETYKNSDNDFDKTINQIYAQLRLVKFLNTKNDD